MRAAPFMSRLLNSAQRFAPQGPSLVNKAAQLQVPDMLVDEPGTATKKAATSGGDVMHGVVPALMQRMGIDTFNDRFNAAEGSLKPPPAASFNDRFNAAGDWSTWDMGAPPGPAVSAQSRNVIDAGQQGNPFPAPNGIRGYNPHVGDMADYAMSEAAGMNKARQVLDPATGTMMNDFYAKSIFPSFYKPFG